jgi:signal transduction histidine kinase
MSIRSKLIVLVALCALVPLITSGVFALRVHQRAFDKKIGELHEKTAETGAARVSGLIDSTVRALELLAARTVRWGELDPGERQGALALVYRQQRDIVVAALLDEKGAGVGTSVYRAPDDPGDLADHPPATMELLSAFAQRIPFRDANAGKTTLGPSFTVGDAPPLVPLALPTAGIDGTRWVVAVGLSLRSACEELARPGEIEVLLVDGGGKVLCGKGAGGAVDRGPRYLTASFPTANGWSVVTRQERAQAFAASSLLRTQAVAAIVASFLLALATGLFLSRSITGPVRALVRGAAELGQGHFEHRLRMQAADELGQLANAFDQMAGEIERRDGEIRAFNTELQQRVEERTRELREAQAELMHSKKITAVASLGAGIAHEINNPLTSVLGFVQVLRLRLLKDGRADDAKLLEIVETESQRIKRIVHTLLSFSQSYAGESFSEVDTNKVIEAALGQLSLGGVELVRDLQSNLPPVLGDATQLQEVVVQLVKNAVTAMRGGGRLTLRTAPLGDSGDSVVKLEVQDTGRGIAPELLEKVFDPFFTTKEDWRGEGLGLTIVHRIVEQHHGRVRAVSRVGEGSTFTVTLPAASRRAHLS